MANLKYRIKVSEGKHSGTKIASGTLAMVKEPIPNGRRIYQTRAQIHTRIYMNSNGAARRK